MNPPRLHPGDTVAIISPSNTVADRPDVVEQARHNFEQDTGLKTVLAPNAMAQHYYSGGTAQQRVDDFHWALKNPDVKAILFSAGGWTAIELVDKLDYELIKANPKIIAGISDASTLLDAIYVKTGLITFHGLEFMDFAKQDMTYTYESIQKAWFTGELGDYAPNPNWRDFNDRPTSYTGWQTIRPGVAAGKIIGGNFSCFTQLKGTEYFPGSFKDTILVIESYKWPKKHIHQALVAAGLWGILDQINGLVIGYIVGSDNPKQIGNDRPMKDLVLEATDGYDFPVMWVGEIGHNIENLILPIGAQAELDAINKQFRISEKTVD